MTSAVLPPDRPGSPSSLIVSFSGLHLRRVGGWIAVADLVTALARVELPATAVRQAVTRLKTRGFLAAARRGTVAGYTLTELGERDLITGDRRIFTPPDRDPDAGWAVAVFSVPESDRDHRHRLRSLLSGSGFGAVAKGVWIAPRPLVAPTRAELAAGDLDRYVTWLAVQDGAGALIAAPDAAAVARWWDLPGLAAQYRAFLDSWESVDPGAVTAHGGEAAAFAEDLRLVDGWRVFPRTDPGLPSALLPPDWPGHAAWECFARLRDAWAGPAAAWVDDLVGRAGRRSG